MIPSVAVDRIEILADGASSVHVEDVDSDGDMDIFSSSINDDKLAW